jgi:hypothetical protein
MAVDTNMFPLVFNAEREDLTADGALSVDTYLSTVAVAAGANMTLADGTKAGQVKKVLNLDASVGCEVTVATPRVSGDKVIDIDAVGDFVTLMWDGEAWFIIDQSSGMAHAAS